MQNSAELFDFFCSLKYEVFVGFMRHISPDNSLNLLNEVSEDKAPLNR